MVSLLLTQRAVERTGGWALRLSLRSQPREGADNRKVVSGLRASRSSVYPLAPRECETSSWEVRGAQRFVGETAHFSARVVFLDLKAWDGYSSSRGGLSGETGMGDMVQI